MTGEAVDAARSPFGLAGKVAIITGSSRGIGRASAEAMARLGAKVVMSSRKAAACEEAADAIRRQGGEAAVILEGVLARARAGNAASSEAEQTGSRGRALADSGWELARSAA